MADKKFRVMIVDDEEDMRTLLAMCLGDHYEVFSATNGLDALLKLPRYEPDLALLDIMMPLMDGNQLARKIRATPGFAEMPIIMLSALNSRDDIKNGYDSGANLYLTKPFQPERVLRNVAMSLEGFEPRTKKIPIAEVEEAERRNAEHLRRALQKPHAPSAKPMPSRVANPLPTLGKSAAAKAAADLKHGRPADVARARILLVDDDDDFVLVARTALEDDFEVVVADDGFDALGKVPEAEPDLFIVDGMMPRMSGFQLIDILRESIATAFKPILFVSARCTERDQRMLAGKGIEHFLEKPFTPQRLVEKMHELTETEGFMVAPKKIPIRELLYVEGKRRAAAKEVDDRRKRWDSGKEIKEFLASEFKDSKKG